MALHIQTGTVIPKLRWSNSGRISKALLYPLPTVCFNEKLCFANRPIMRASAVILVGIVETCFELSPLEQGK
jgi:hypothetical protein